MKGFPDLPPIWFALAWGLIWGINRLVPQLSVTFALQSALAWIYLIAGVGLILWSALWFYKKRTSIEPHHSATSLLVEGPFRFTRNPIYLGLAFILAGSIIGRGVWLAVPVLAGFVWIIHKRFVIPEADGLVETFGDQAKDYLAKTRPWI